MSMTQSFEFETDNRESLLKMLNTISSILFDDVGIVISKKSKDFSWSFDDGKHENRREYYVYQTIEEADAGLAVINGFMPVIGVVDGKPSPLNEQTTKWHKEPTLMLSGEYAIPRIPNIRLDNSGELVEIDGVWAYTGVPMQVRIDFMAVHGTDVRALTKADFPVEVEIDL